MYGIIITHELLMETKRRDEQMKICLSGTDKYEIRPLESEGERVSYYDALTFIKYYDKVLTNPELLDKVEIRDVEDLLWSNVLKEGVIDINNQEKLVNYILENEMNLKEYTLLSIEGEVDIIHLADDIESLKNGYKPSEEVKETFGGSFGVGLYALYYERNKSLLGTVDGDRKWYKGTFKGKYFVCIEDYSNGEKDGSQDIAAQEIFIPFNTKDIIWEM